MLFVQKRAAKATFRVLESLRHTHCPLPFPTRLPQRRMLCSSNSDTQDFLVKLPNGPLSRYELMVTQGVLQHDEQQHQVVEALDALLKKLKEHQKHMELFSVEARRWEAERMKLRQQLLKAESEVEARKRIQSYGQENENGLLSWWKNKRRRSLPEPGVGRMVARIKREKKLDTLMGPRPSPPNPPRGIYLYGNVGCGKTLLMDLFFHSSEGLVRYRRRVHFHAIMLEVHDQMHKLWKQRSRGKTCTEDPGQISLSTKDAAPSTMEMVAQEWLSMEERFQEELEQENLLDIVADHLLWGTEDHHCGASLLCFDEVQVMDVFTAVAVAKILARLLERGTVIVATSNRAPYDLNKDGMQKELFEKFLQQLEKQCLLMLVGVEKDYRRVLAQSALKQQKERHYFWPLDDHSQLELEKRWNDVKCFGTEHPAASTMIPVMFGRMLEIPESYAGFARFSFDQLCDCPVGSADYIALAQNYHTIFITGIPIMSMKIRDKARRFITLVDELYNHHCRLICTAAAPPDELFLGTEEGPLIDFESLQFETEAEGGRLRRDVSLSGSLAPLATTYEARASIVSLLSGREEFFAFQRAISRLIEMQTPNYLHTTKHMEANSSKAF
ncbi:hypothetical protein O6H91_03G039300 [Diphasiastrum complanatum]|uniref:Uncharacterized protein n=1 Tax=Diphasiastrum complanatum TaxID=34168 RepID=A0ACC2E5F6_DIPCM|nr:hypothetical protein O6H91_03G039300 [Diphasiastrum complanatum]